MRSQLPETHPSTPDPIVQLLFEELNDHIRANDNKQLRISIGYFTLLAIALSILTTRPDFIDSWRLLLAHGVLITVGCMTVFIQDSYRGWKIHYRVRCQRIINTWPAGYERFAPWWMTIPPYESPQILRLSPDNALTYFTFGTTTVLVVIFDIALARLVESTAQATFLIVGASALYAAFMLAMKLRGHRRKRKVRAGIY